MQNDILHTECILEVRFRTRPPGFNLDSPLFPLIPLPANSAVHTATPAMGPHLGGGDATMTVLQQVQGICKAATADVVHECCAGIGRPCRARILQGCFALLQAHGCELPCGPAWQAAPCDHALHKTAHKEPAQPAFESAMILITHQLAGRA